MKVIVSFKGLAVVFVAGLVLGLLLGLRVADALGAVGIALGVISGV